MKLTEFIREQFVRARNRRAVAGEVLGHEDPSSRRLAVYGMVGRSVAPRDIHLTSGDLAFVLHAGNGRLQGATLHEDGGAVSAFDFSGRPAILVDDREKAELLRGFIAFMARPGQIGLRLEARDGEAGAHGLGPEILVGDPGLFDSRPERQPGGEGDTGPGHEAAPAPVEPGDSEPLAPDAAPVAESDLAQEMETATSLEPETVSAPEPEPLPEAPGEPQLTAEAVPEPDPVVAGASALLTRFAERLSDHVDDRVIHGADAAGPDGQAFDAIGAFVAEVSPDLGETLLLVYSGGDGDGESLAIAVDNGCAVALQLRRTRLGKVFQEWQALAPGDR